MIATIISYNKIDAVIGILERWLKEGLILSYITVNHPASDIDKKDHIHILVEIEDYMKLDSMLDPAIVSEDLISGRVLWHRGSLSYVVYALHEPNIVLWI